MKNAWSGFGWIAAFGVAIFAFAYSPSHHRYYKDCANVNHGRAVPAALSTRVDEGVQSSGDSQKQAEKDQRDLTITCSNLAAQWAIVDYTHRAFWLGLIGIFFIFLTLRYTRETADAANMTLAEAEKATGAAWVAADAAREEVRPWIFLDRKFECDFLADNIRFQVRWNYSLKNIGKSVARNVTLGQKLVTYENLFSLERMFNDYAAERTESAKGYSGNLMLPNESRDEKQFPRWAGISTIIRHPLEKFALLVCVTYILPDGSVGYDAQTFVITEGKQIGPVSHKLMGYASLRQAH